MLQEVYCFAIVCLYEFLPSNISQLFLKKAVSSFECIELRPEVLQAKQSVQLSWDQVRNLQIDFLLERKKSINQGKNIQHFSMFPKS